jgi:sulfatase modifying factor 1
MNDTARGGISYVMGNANGSKYAVKSDFELKPVNFVTWYDAARMANWMHNGQGSGGTEAGAYDMLLETPARMAGATVFFAVGGRMV